jgi:ABC-type branched-subunit amino acid transport system substrate-binding protein
MRRLARSTSALLTLVLVASACSGAPKRGAAAGGDGVGVSTTSTTRVAGATGVATTTSTVSVPDSPDPRVSGTSAEGGIAGPAAPMPTAAPASSIDVDLYRGASNTRGITKDRIVLCAHAALTNGPAFNATPEDFNGYYDAVNDQGGIYGRTIHATYENDNDDPVTAVHAAEACRAKNPAFILSGAGFDPIPSVRRWAEQNHELYFHHSATERGAAGRRFSYTTQPSVEATGRAFAELAASRFPKKKIGVLYRNTDAWRPGYDAFARTAADDGLQVVLAVPVEQNQANYTQALLSLRNAGVSVVFGWEDAIALTEMIKQAKAQQYSPQWLAMPYDLTSQTLADDAVTPTMLGVAPWPGFSAGDHGGTFTSYAADMKEFEREYAKYRPTTDLGGVAGDLLWINWVYQRQLVALLQACGPDCTRDRLAGVLAAGWKTEVSPGCSLDFGGGAHDGSGQQFDVLETYRAPSGKVNWRSTARCQRHPT